MKRFACALVLAGAIVACAVSRQPAPYSLVDLATPYESFWDESRNLPAAERVAAFKTRFETLLPGFFRAERVGWMTNEQYDAEIARSFERFPAIRGRYTAITTGFARLIAPAHESFARAFPDLRPIGRVYIVHSVGELDGGTRTISGESHLVFGADVMAQVHDFSDETPFFHHELFHVYHAQFFSGCEEMWCAVWSEGLATVAAQSLSPRATDAQLLLTSPRPIRPEVERNRDAAVCAVASRLDSKDAADYAALFSNGPGLTDLPPRVGYFIGYLVAKEAAGHRSVKQLAHMDNEAAREVVAATFARLAHCPAKLKL